MSSQSVLTSAYWNDPANDILKCNKEFIGAYVDETLNDSVLAKLMKVEDISEINPKFASFEANGTVGVVPEGANIPNFPIGKGYETIISPVKNATRIEMTYEMLKSIRDPERDALELVTRRSKIVLAAFRKTLEQRAVNYFDNAFTASFNPVTQQSFIAPDAQPLISATHTYQTGGGFSNLLTNAALSTAIIDEVYTAAANTLGADGKPVDLMPTTIFVRMGSEAERDAMRIFGYNNGSNNNQYHTATLGDVNIYEGGTMRIVSSRYFNFSAGTPANRGKSYFFLSDFDNGVLENPLKMLFNERP